MWPIVEYLKKPELVVNVQEWFGIEYLDKNEQKINKNENTLYDRSMTSDLVQNRYSNCAEHKIHRRNGCDDFCANSNENHNESTTARNYRINNKFWYYLFLLGTELGDETFYAISIPFWLVLE